MTPAADSRRWSPRRFATAIAVAAFGLGAAGAATASALTVSVVGSDGRPLPGAVVAVVVKGARTTAAPGTSAEIAQRERMFQPTVSVIQAGTSVQFPNFDTVRHHVYSFSPIQKFELKLYAGTPAAPVVFDKPGIAVLGCNIHDRMNAWVAVVDTPYFAKADANGVAVLEAPAGDQRLRTWHPLLGETGAWREQPLQVDTAATAIAVQLPVAEAR